MEDSFTGWPEYECRTVNNFAPNSCDLCGNLSQRFYWCYDEDVITWHTMCNVCESTRDRSLRELYI